MADGIELNLGSGGATAATDEVGGVHYQYIKATWGPDGTVNFVDTATGKPLPIQLRTATGLIPIGEPTDAKNTATDTTSVAIIPLLKQISASVQAPPSQAVTVAALTNFGAGEYETVAASQTAQVLGPTGATGDFISGILVVPATTSPGNVLLLDNATSMTVFAGGSLSVASLVPFLIPLGMISVSGAWKITTGANVSVIGIGNFT